MTDKKYKILIVDDDEFLLNLYVSKFRKEGLDAETVTGGVAALEKLKSGYVPDAMMIDIVMPTMSGLELLEEIKKQKLGVGSIIVILTNQGASEDIKEATRLGADGYIVKASSIPSEVLTELLKILKERKK